MFSAWYEVLSVLHLMAMLLLSQANLLLLPRSSASGYEAKVSEESRRATIDIFLKAAGYLDCAVRQVLPQIPNELRRNLPVDLTEGVLRALCLEALGQDFNPNPVIPPQSGRPDQVQRVLKAKFHDAMTKLPPQKKELDLLIVILPDNNGCLYGDLKRICETNLGVVSQCCLTKHVFKMNKQYLANVTLKINVKVGGRNTVLVDALSRRIPLVSDLSTIIFGANVTHPHPGEDSSPSIAAVVASQDWHEATKYAGLVRALSPSVRN